MAHAFDEEIVFAVAALGRGEIVGYPTETFYGLGVDALDELALARLRLLKGRGEKAISALVSRFGRPLTTTSANRAGEPPATTAEEVEQIFEGRCRVLHGGATPGGAP